MKGRNSRGELSHWKFMTKGSVPFTIANETDADALEGSFLNSICASATGVRSLPLPKALTNSMASLTVSAT